MAKIKNWNGVDKSLYQLSELESKLVSLQHQYDDEVLTLERKYSERDDLKDQIQKIKLEIEDYAEAHREEVEGNKREFPNGIIRWAKTPLAVRLLNNTPVDIILNMIKSSSWVKKFTVTKIELDKTGIKKAFKQGEISNKELSKYSIECSESEKLYIEAKPL